MSGKPKTIPSASRERKSVSDSQQIPVPYDHNRARQCVETDKAGIGANVRASSPASSDTPTDENFVNDDIIEENSHVIPPTKKSGGKQGRKGQPAQ